jgi:hypothetical protein
LQSMERYIQPSSKRLNAHQNATDAHHKSR